VDARSAVRLCGEPRHAGARAERVRQGRGELVRAAPRAGTRDLRCRHLGGWLPGSAADRSGDRGLRLAGGARLPGARRHGARDPAGLARNRRPARGPRPGAGRG
jgi:hypothetical protein